MNIINSNYMFKEIYARRKKKETLNFKPAKGKELTLNAKQTTF